MVSFVDEYAQLRRTTLRTIARRLAVNLLHRAQMVQDRVAPAPARSVQFVHLHYVFRDEIDGFRALLRDLRGQYRFLTYSEAVQRVETGAIDGRYIAFSFDDGLKNGLTAAQILEEFGARACFFVCPEMVEQRDDRAIEAFCRSRLGMPPVEFLDWDDLAALRSAGHEVGSHTYSHHRLSNRSADEIQHDVGTSHVALTRQLGRVVHFAWPYGRFDDFNATAARAVFAAGFKTCASAERGCHVARPVEPSAPGWCIRRDLVVAGEPQREVAYFVARNLRARRVGTRTWPRGWFAER